MGSSKIGVVRAAYREYKWTWFSSVFFGLIIAIPLANNLDRWCWGIYDTLRPVVRYKAELVGRRDDSVFVHIWGEKLRDCQAVLGSLQSYTLRDGVYFDAYAERVEGIPSSRPVGKVDIGVFRVWPTKSGTHVVMTVLHRCDGRLVTSELARVGL